MRPDRELAVEAMRNMGWSAQRKTDRRHPYWVFTRPDTGGLHDHITRKQSDLSMNFVAEIAMQYGDAPDLVKEISEAKERWLRSRFLGIYSRNFAASEATK